MTTRLVAATFVTLLLAGLSVAALAAAGTAETFHPIQSPLPVPPPSDAIVLLDGKGTHLFVSMRGGKIDWPVDHSALVSTLFESSEAERLPSLPTTRIESSSRSCWTIRSAASIPMC